MFITEVTIIMDEKKEILVNETGSFDDQAQVTTSLGEGKDALLIM